MPAIAIISNGAHPPRELPDAAAFWLNVNDICLCVICLCAGARGIARPLLAGVWLLKVLLEPISAGV